ncbi:MAG: transcription antitermination factor NusB [Pseudomonadales bacterium]|jgi:N utilization substance protein B
MSDDSKPKKQRLNPSLRRKARQLAMQALYQWELASASLVAIELEFREDNDMKKVDADYFSELLHRVPAMKSELDDLIRPLLDRDIGELTPVELTILRLSGYELLKRPDVPYRVIINEGVELAKTFGATDGHKYVNGILDKLARELRLEARL